MMSRILLNGLHYVPNGAGISNYTHRLLDAFIKGNYDVDILMQKVFQADYKDERIQYISDMSYGSSKRIVEEQLKQRKFYKKYDLVHFPDYATPVFYKGYKVATIHDMAMHTMRDKYTLMQNVTKNTLLQSTIKKANALICDSNFSKKELLNYYPQVADRAQVIHLGVDIPHYLMKQEEKKSVLDKFGIYKEFILYVGTIAPHKNISNLIKAYSYLKKQNSSCQLVIAGKKGWMYEEVFDEVKSLRLEKEVIFTDFITDEEREVLYHAATCFASVSLYEGFGFPPLEAMGRGCPVLVSDIEVFKEVCGESVLYCNPKDTIDIAKQLKLLLETEELRDKLREKGLKQVQKFSWEETARQTYKVYEAVLKEQEVRRG